ncbi:tetratricopeptide repeat protein [Granulosicoccus antarcticus]|uniref:tetratricopeptide repeat protein n=1 Tax=Granulosicoccus antarcticus TaxID=437505 RepID=UPI003AADA425
MYRAQERYVEAGPLYIEAVEILEKVVGADHPNTIAVKGTYEHYKAALDRP